MSSVVLVLVLCLGWFGPSDKGPSPEAAECLAKVKAIHGGTGPWAVAGYRIGQRALKELKLPPQSFALMIVHKSPAQVQYTCMADGLQAATGASLGKLNLKLAEAASEALETEITDRNSGRTLAFSLRPELVRTIKDLSFEKLEAAGARVAELPDDAIFTMREVRPPATKPQN